MGLVTEETGELKKRLEAEGWEQKKSEWPSHFLVMRREISFFWILRTKCGVAMVSHSLAGNDNISRSDLAIRSCAPRSDYRENKERLLSLEKAA